MIPKEIFNFIWLYLLASNFILAQDLSHPAYTEEFYKFCRSFEEKMEMELNLYSSYVGHREELGEKLDQVEMKFHVPHSATIEEARALTVYLTTQLVHTMNENIQLHPFLKETPFTYRNVWLSLIFIDPDRSVSYDGSVVSMHKLSDTAADLEDHQKITYYSADPFSDQFEEILKEYYDEALEKTKLSKLAFPFLHHKTEKEMALEQVFDAFHDQLRETRLWTSRLGGVMDGSIQALGGKLRCEKRCHVEEARKLLLFATEKLQKAINSNDKLRPYLAEYPFPIKRLNMCLDFIDETFFHHHDGSLKQVQLKDNTVTYTREFTTEEMESGQPLEDRLVHQETYDEAVNTAGK